MPSVKKLFLLIIALSAQQFALFSQFNQTEIFTLNDGLAMTECGLAFCDRSGKIWINHSTGWISVYDGYSFTRYSPQETGAYLDGAQFVEDQKGLWIRKEKTVSLFSNDKWKYFDAPSVWNIAVDRKSDTMVLLDKFGGLWRLNAEGDKLIPFSKLPLKEAGQEYTLIPSRLHQSYLLLITKSGIPFSNHKAFVSNSLLHPNWIETPHLVTPGLDWAFQFTSTDQLSHLKVQFPKSNPLKINTNISVARNDLLYTQIFPNALDNDFIIETYKIDSSNSFQFMARYKSGHENVSVTMDLSGNLWIASHSGLSRVNPSIIQCMDDMAQMIPSLHAINEDEQGRIWFGGYTTGLCYFKDGMLFQCPAEARKFKRFLPGSYRDYKGKMAFWSEDHDLIIYDQGNWKKAKAPDKDEENIRGYYFLPIHDGKIAAGLQRFGLGITQTPLSINSTWKIISKEKGMLLDNVLTISEDSNHKLWLGRISQGIAVYDPALDTAQTWLLAPDSEFNYGMLSSVIDPAGRLWMGCNDGLRVIEKPANFKIFKDEILSKIYKVSLGEAGSSQINILTTYKQFLIFGNSTGYAFLDLNSYAVNPASPKIYFFPMGKFGMSCEQNAILIDRNENLWIGHDKGAMRLDLNGNYLDSSAVNLFAKSVIAHGIKNDTSVLYFDSTNFVKLPANKRNITVQIQPDLNGWLNNNIYIQYSLIGRRMKDTLWSAPSKSFDIQLEILPPGRNLLLVKGIKNNQTATTSSFSIIVPPRLTETFWFWFLLFCITSYIGFLITRNVYRQRLQLRLAQINLAEQQREKNQFQISAIANSLNPHFIKNTLMWMQSRFRKDQEVVDVIDRLAYNIGNVFSHSRKGHAFHTLEEEMKLTENFLAIQLATYGPFINIHLPEEIQWQEFRQIKVPLLLIQIHVENAIEHGLRPKAGREKNLRLILNNNVDYLIATIVDDGIGRKAARERGSRGTNQGTSMLDRVFELYNQKNQFQFYTSYEDLYDINGLSFGTKVIIQIPKQYNTDLK